MYSTLAVLALCWAGALASTVLSPTDRVRNGVNQVLDVLRDSTLDRESRQSRIREIIDQGFDFQ